jgi:acetylornithine deacetylase/succinyl-diaminopimelate desuccinylase-like protein
MLNIEAGFCNVVARLPGKKVFSFSMDTSIFAPKLDVDPFGAEIREGKMYGRGTCDMKSGIASMMAAMIGFKRTRTPFNG